MQHPEIANTWCVDFDGVLAYHITEMGPEIGEPLRPGLELVRTLLREGRVVIVLTARPVEEHQTVYLWLVEHDAPVHKVTNVKPPARYYVDDRAITWPRNLSGGVSTFMNFMPRNRIEEWLFRLYCKCTGQVSYRYTYTTSWPGKSEGKPFNCSTRIVEVTDHDNIR